MQAFICCAIVPNGWSQTDIVTAMNIGMQQLAKEQGKTLEGICYSNTVLTDFSLERQDI